MRYRVATNPAELAQADRAGGCHEVQTIEQAADIMRPHGFDGCAVWRYDGAARHWRLIFDTSIPDRSRLPASLYWCNVAQNEKGGRA